MRLSSRATLGLFSAAAMVSLVATAPSRAAEPDGPAALIGPAEALRIAIVTRVADKGAKAGGEYKALADYYSAPDAQALWVDENGLNLRAKSVMEEIGKADDYGLRASDYALPRVDGFNAKSPNSVGTLADAEIKLDVAVLRYARDARGGRFDWTRLDPDLDPTLALPDPLQVMESIAIRSEPAAYLRSFQPDQPQFEALRKALIAARGGHVEDDGVVRIPDGPVLKLGVEHEQVALLRKRLEVPATDGAKETVFDGDVEQAVRRFQEERGYRPDGLVGPGTRRVLNGEQQQSSSPSKTRLILLNMERWRWLPNDLGPFYVAVNIPEFTLRVMEEGKPAFTTRVVVGKPDKQTPIFSNEMQEIVFNPYWNVPNSIKMEELLPSIRGGGDWFFGGGGGGWDASVFARNGLRVALGTKEVDPSMLDWNRIDIRSLNVYQPPGPDNVLGTVKFLFPNKHDVYMHDTTQKNLFAQTVRAESHGCMRVQYPEKLAEIILNHDKGWSPARVESTFDAGGDNHVALDHKIPVYITYFTVKVNDDGSLSTFNDIYGHDSRMIAALNGKYVPYQQASDDEMAASQYRPWNKRTRREMIDNDFTRALFGF